jgi:CHAT domain-containing protein
MGLVMNRVSVGVLIWASWLSAAEPIDRAQLVQQAKERDAERAKLEREGNPAEALPVAQAALALWQQIYPLADYPQSHPNVAVAHTQVAFLQQDLGQLAAAEQQHTQAVTIFRAHVPPEKFPEGVPNLARSLGHLGVVQQAQGKFADAETHFAAALELLGKLHPQGHPSVARMAGNLGGVEQRLGKLHAAVAHYQTALRWHEQLADASAPLQADLAIGHSNLGAGLHAVGQLGLAETHLRAALALHEKLFPVERFPNGHPNLLTTHNNLAALLKAQGQLDEAERHYRRALDMAPTVYPARRFPQGHPEVAALHTNLALVLLALGRHDDAQPLVLTGLEMRRKLYPLGHPSLCISLTVQAALLDLRGQSAEAAYRSALTACTHTFAPARYPLGHPEWAKALNNLGVWLLTHEQAQAALPLLQQALDQRQRLYPDGHPSVVTSLSNVATAQLALQQTEAAQATLRTALQMSTRLVTDAALALPEEVALDVVAQQPLARDAFLTLTADVPSAAIYSEIWPSRACATQALARRVPSAAQQALADLRQQRAQVLLAIAPSSPAEQQRRAEQVQKLSAEIAAHERKLPALTPTAPTTPAQLQAVLPSQTVFIDVLEYVRTGKDKVRHYVAFVVRPERIVRVELGLAAPINAAVRAWRQAVSQTSTAAGTQLAQLVWTPLAAHLPTPTQAVYLALDGALTQVPFAALPGAKPESVLLDEFAVAVVPHGALLLEQLTQPPAAAGPLVVVGAVDYGVGDQPTTANVRAPVGLPPAHVWPALPGTKTELERVQALAAAAQVPTKSLSGSAATPAEVLAQLPQARRVHLATHGYFADASFRSVLQLDEALFARRTDLLGRTARHPLVLSGLVLAGANSATTAQRGIVTAETIGALDLRQMNLAVLSACETGLGDVAGGEGVLGLQRAFQLAGCRTVVAAQWKVSDAATAALMGEFYRQLWQQHQPPLLALRAAQQWLRHQALRDPGLLRGMVRHADDVRRTTTSQQLPAYYWAAFTLAGAGR